MKKGIMLLVLAITLSGVSYAQINDSGSQFNGSSIGLRLGYPTELSFQTGHSGVGRLELGLGLRTYPYAGNKNYTQFSFSGIHQWVWNLSSVGYGFNWYLGLGASVGYYSYSTFSGYPVSVLGQVGLEYNFNIPLRLSLDYRPAFQVTKGTGFIGDGIALGIRYRL